jgi:dihydrofolate reductase
MLISLDGFFEGKDHDISWHNAGGQEFNAFALDQNKNTGTFLFGRRTYDLMKSWWPTIEAKDADPEIAKMMNETPKVVVSTTRDSNVWENTTFIQENIVEEIKKLKDPPSHEASEGQDKDIMIFGSNELTVSLMKAGLVDEFRIMVNPIVLSEGTKLFAGLGEKHNLKLVKVQRFDNGNILLDYEPKS